MVKKTIRVYARLKKEKEDAPGLTEYEITGRKHHDELFFNEATQFRFGRSVRDAFKFHKIFDRPTSQDEVFLEVAKPVIARVLDGYNGTIFAYGQTGSGKTFSMTGSPDRYDDRGIIPRTVECIFETIQQSSDLVYNIYISYLEIYNETGYDLLNPKHRITRIEELPRVSILEDRKGESHLKNLSILPVGTEKEAMRLLFLGETNRTIAETPSNMYSTRSHCIFTVHVAARVGKAVRRSKLHLVDLAGSERVHKTNISGICMTEARHINLSLHYLEQVIAALSEARRSHIPYRNSMMTLLLKDSLAGNCLTTMLSTISTNANNLQESISTCKFAQRVAMINTEASVNEDIDPHLEAKHLREEIARLKSQLSVLGGSNITGDLTKEQEHRCHSLVEEFVTSCSSELPIEGDMRQIQLCFRLLRQQIPKCESKPVDENHKDLIDQRDQEISVLIDLLREERTKNEYQSNSYGIAEDTQQVQSLKSSLRQKYDVAQSVANRIEQCKSNIVVLKRKIEQTVSGEGVNKAMVQLETQQNIYRESLLELQKLKSEIDHLKHGIDQIQVRSKKNSPVVGQKVVSPYQIPACSCKNPSTRLSVSSPPGLDLECIPTKESAVQPTPPPIKNYQETMPIPLCCKPEKETSCIDLVDTKVAVSPGATSRSDAPIKREEEEEEEEARKEDVATAPLEDKDFLENVPLTGDPEVDEEIIQFYRARQNVGVL